MRRRGAVAGIALCAFLASVAAAGAQIDPDDTGAGDKLGLTQQNNSGQVGTVSLFGGARRATLVVIDLQSEGAGRSEPARIEHRRSCERGGAPAAFELAPVRNGASRTVVPAFAAKLLSGNYVLAVYASASIRSHAVSCGELHR